MGIERTLQRALQDASSGRLRQAIDSVRVAMRLSPSDPAGIRVLGMLLVQANEFEQALQVMQRAVAQQPGAADLHSNLGNVLFSLNRFPESVAAYRRALQLDPDCAPAHFGLSGALVHSGDSAGALEAADRCERLNPGTLRVQVRRVDAFDIMERHGEAIALLRQLIAQHPGDAEIRARLLQILNYSAEPDEEFDAAITGYAQCIGRVPAFGAFDRDPERPLRLGILSPDLRTHSVGYFAQAFARHVQPGWTLVAFSTIRAPKDDAMARAFREWIPEWVDASMMSDEELDRAIRDRRIDVLLDMAGHSNGNRLRALDRKPAPLVATAIGHPATTGHPAIDVRLVDSITDPPGSERACTERLQRMDPCFLCYAPPDTAPEPEMPAADAPVTFGSFNLTAKVGPECLALWKLAMDAVPGSRLLLKARSLGDPGTRGALLERMRAAGIDESRMELLAYVPGIDAHLRLYGRVHAALDTTPYGGTTTTCEALWMGVPVVTLPGARHASRVSASLLRAAGFGELVADDAAGFVRIAARAATDRAWAEDFRRTARARMAASPLMDAPAYAARFYGALRDAWRWRCAK